MHRHCFDSTKHVLFHPIREQTSQLARASGHRPDGRYHGTATQRRLHLPTLYGEECSYIKRKASVVQHSELADQ